MYISSAVEEAAERDEDVSALHAGCVERKTHGVWSATYVTMIFVRNASATAYGEKEREKWREYVLSFDEQEM